MLIIIGWNRIYAVTRKNHIITMGFGLITISQFTLGLYLIAKQGGESLTKWRPQSIPTPILQHSKPYRSHLTLIECVFSHDIGPWKSDLPLYL